MRLLEGDSRFFGFPVALMEEDDDLVSVRGFLRDERVVFCTAKVPLEYDIDPLVRLGFRVVEARTGLSVSLGVHFLSSLHEGYREAEPRDQSALLRLAPQSSFDRYHRDHHFARDVVARFRMDWVRKLLRDPACFFIVCEAAGIVIGFVACVVDGGVGDLRLIVVDEEHRGRGVGLGLVRAALSEFSRRGLGRAVVVTQDANRVALRMYRRAGFRKDDKLGGLTLHYWNKN